MFNKSKSKALPMYMADGAIDIALLYPHVVELPGSVIKSVTKNTQVVGRARRNSKCVAMMDNNELDTRMLGKEIRDSIKPMIDDDNILQSVIFTHRGLHVEVFLPDSRPNGRKLASMIRKSLRLLNKIFKDEIGLKNIHDFNYVVFGKLTMVNALRG